MVEDRTGEPQANQRLTVAQTAATLGITEGAVRSRIKRGTLPTIKEGGTVFVLLGSGSSASGSSQAYQPPNTGVPTAHTEELIRTLREQLELERQAHAEARRLLAAALERIPAIEAPQEPPGASEAATEMPMGREPQEAREEAQEPSEPPKTSRSRLREFFGFD